MRSDVNNRFFLLIASGLLLVPVAVAAQTDYSASAAPAAAPSPYANDKRVGLRAGMDNAGEAIENLKLVAHRSRPAGFFDSVTAGKHEFVNADLAFMGNYIVQGNYY